MCKCVTTIVGQSDWSRHCYCFHVSHTASPVATGGICWAKPPKLKYENYKWVEFFQFLPCQGINREIKNSLTITWVIFTRIHTNHNVGWFSPELTLTIMSGDFHPSSQSTTTSSDFHLGTTWLPLLSGWKSTGISIPRVWVIFAEKLKLLNADKCSPSLAVRTKRGSRAVLMVDRFHSVVWSQSSCPQ